MMPGAVRFLRSWRERSAYYSRVAQGLPAPRVLGARQAAPDAQGPLAWRGAIRPLDRFRTSGDGYRLPAGIHVVTAERCV
jgi:hypothetical protein